MTHELSVRSEHAFEISNFDSLLEVRPASLPAMVTEPFIVPVVVQRFEAAACSPATPVDQLNGYTNNINGFNGQIAAVLNSTPSGSLQMGTFAAGVNNFAAYLNSIPNSFCIGPGNQAAYDALNNSLGAAITTVNRGKAFFETSLDSFSARATPFLNALLSESSRIDATSRDFTGVLAAFRNWDVFFTPYDGKVEVWTLTPRIQATWSALTSLFERANSALTAAIAQIETNVETEARVFDARRATSEQALALWENIDGKEGYDRYAAINREMEQVLIPAFNALLRRVPATERVKQAIARAQTSVTGIVVGLKSFPNLDPLPPSDASFPHDRYLSAETKFTGGLLRNELITIAQAYHARTGRMIDIGDCNYQHGGKIRGSSHKSHNLGIDGDLKNADIGSFPSNDKKAALALAGCIPLTKPVG